MFWQKIRHSHRIYLSVITTITVSLGLAITFVLVFAIVRSQTLSRRYNDLGQMADRVAIEWKGPESLKEQSDDFPDLSISVYSHERQLLGLSTKRSDPFFVGQNQRNDLLIVGKAYSQVVVVASTSWKETQEGLAQLALVLAILWLPLSGLTAVVCWFGSGLILRPIQELVESASRLSGAIENEKLTTTDQAEFAQLASALNDMLARIHHSSQLQEQFASDAAHELRTPLAILRTRIETVLLKGRTSDEYQGSLKAMLGEVDRLTHLIETLLVSARTPFDNPPPIDFTVAVSQIVSEWKDRQGDSCPILELTLIPSSVAIEEDEVSMILANLLDNAKKHAPLSTSVKISIRNEENKVLLTVSDEGPGIKEADREVVFERFYRVDAARNRSKGGNGIGLSVVKRLIVARGGQIAFLPVTKGATIQISLPSAEA